MSTAPSIKVTLSHTSGALSGYLPGTGNNVAEHGGLREAIVTVVAHIGERRERVELLRSDIPGADWSAMDRAGAFPELQARLQRSALDLADGHEPHVVVTLTPERGMGEAKLVTSNEERAQLMADPNKRSLVVPRILPYQLGGGADGATAVVYSPVAGGGLKLHSMHPDEREALMAEMQLKSSGEGKTGLLKVHTSVTALLASVAAGTYKPAPPAFDDSAPTQASGATRAHPGLMPSVLAAPSPFSTT